jgi:membrane glycosyltransferase
MIVLDADSVMTGECLTTLVRLMEAHTRRRHHPDRAARGGHETLHAPRPAVLRARTGRCSPPACSFWQLGESHYWGHNAILRMAPFMAHCALAPLPGKGALGRGPVARLRRGGADAPRRLGLGRRRDLDGSYEQVPPNLLAELQRDRRWCHGNLQNSRLMFEPGLHPVHRSSPAR